MISSTSLDYFDMFALFNKLKGAKKLPPPTKKPFECTACHKRFSNAGALAGHLRFNPLQVTRPTLDRPEQCQECSRTFPSQRSLVMPLLFGVCLYG